MSRKSNLLSVLIFTIILVSIKTDLTAQPNQNIRHLTTRMFTIFPQNGVMRDSLLYVIGNDQDNYGQFAVYDVSDPTDPLESGYTLLPMGDLVSLSLSDNLALILHGSGVGLFDISDPWQVRHEGGIEFEGAVDMVRSENFLYVSLIDGMLNVYEIIDNFQVELVNEIDVDDTLTNLYINGDKLFAGENQFNVYSLTDPETPQLISSIDVQAYDIVARDGFAYVASHEDGVLIYELDNEDDPTQISNIGLNNAVELALWQGNLMVSQQELEINDIPYAEINVYNIDNPLAPDRIGFIQSDSPGGFSTSKLISGDSNIAFICGYRLLMDLNRISENNHYQIQYSKLGGSLNNEYKMVTVAGGNVFVGRPEAFEYSNATNPKLFGFDISEPTSPQQVYSLARERGVFFVGGTETHIFIWEEVGNEEIELRAYEVEDGQIGQLVGSIDGANIRAYYYNYAGQFTDGSLICRMREPNGFVEIDISDPASMSIIAEYPTEARPSGRFVVDPVRRVIYSSVNENQRWDGILRLDISDSENPVELERFNPGHTSVVPKFDGNRLYFREEGSIYVFDASDPSDIWELARYPIRDLVSIKLVKDNILLFNTKTDDDPMKLHMWNVSDPDNQVEIGYYQTDNANVTELYLQGTLLISNNRSEVNFYDVSEALTVPLSPNLPPHKFSLHAAYPNPFNSFTNISYELPQAGQVSLQVYNPLGQQITTLFEGYRSVGMHTSNLTADNLPSGLYFVRLNASDQVFTQKVVLIR